MRQITHQPRLSSEGLTLDEVKAFVAEAKRNEIPGDALIEVRTRGFSTLRIREISADDRHVAQPEAKKK
jgi:hypothetical protein